MDTRPVEFINQVGYRLAALLDTPDGGDTRAFALFAHCFTCGKDLKPFAQMNQSLTSAGIAVLRFDFSGLGKSEGDFTESTLSSNERDMLDAVSFLRDNYEAPKLLIGHSLGGAAVIRVAPRIDSVTSVVTIATASDPTHLGEKLARTREEARERGSADVAIGGRTFTLNREFFDDLDRKSLHEDVATLGRALLVMHSPLDRTVDIENAARIFQAAKHPKSFVSLDRADHLMLTEGDARYAGAVIAAWAQRYI